MGGLFQAQNEQLRQLMPNITAPVEGGNIGSGQFGSLRGQTAVNKAMGDAQAQLAAQQMQAALTNQATGVNAATGVGNIENQEIKNLLDVGQYEQASPFVNVSNYGKVVGGISAPTTVENQTQLSPLNQVAGILAAMGGTGSGTGVLNSLGVKDLGSIFDSISKAFSSSGGGGGGSTVPDDYESTTGSDPGYSDLY
jgi:hypothetical protein